MLLGPIDRRRRKSDPIESLQTRGFPNMGKWGIHDIVERNPLIFNDTLCIV